MSVPGGYLSVTRSPIELFRTAKKMDKIQQKFIPGQGLQSRDCFLFKFCLVSSDFCQLLGNLPKPGSVFFTCSSAPQPSFP